MNLRFCCYLLHFEHIGQLKGIPKFDQKGPSKLHRFPDLEIPSPKLQNGPEGNPNGSQNDINFDTWPLQTPLGTQSHLQGSKMGPKGSHNSSRMEPESSFSSQAKPSQAPVQPAASPTNQQASQQPASQSASQQQVGGRRQGRSLWI